LEELKVEQEYLKVTIFNRDFYILKEEFLSKVEESKGKHIPPKGEIDIGSPVETRERNTLLFSLYEVLNFIIEKAGISTKDLKEIDILYIVSEYHLFLELPWERLVKGVVIREVPSQDNRQNDKDLPISENSLLIITSYAYKYIGDKLEEGLNKEIKKIRNICIQENGIKYRMNNIALNRHTTKEQIERIDFTQFSFLHFAMHGYEKGGIYLSNNSTDRYKYVITFTTKDLLKIVSNCKFKLAFFSTCYSGGGLNGIDEQVLAFEFVKEGISDYAIGYPGKSGNDSLPTFAELFYKHFMSCDDIEVVYERAIREYNKSCKNSEKYIPYLYKSI